MYPDATGAYANHKPMYEDTTTFAQILNQQRNYRTGFIGKWHLDGLERPGLNATNDFGWIHSDYKWNRGHYKFVNKENSSLRLYPFDEGEKKFNNTMEENFLTDFLIDRGINFIDDSIKKDKAFALMISIPGKF